MATKISSDISTNVDITARKSDSFFLEVSITNEDSSIFDLTDFSAMSFEIKNSNNNIIKSFISGGAINNTTEGSKPQTITKNETLGKIIINVPAFTTTTGVHGKTYDNMNLPVGSYAYTLVIQSATDVNTILHGKFKSVD